jgi:hypothetical protein
MSLRDEKSSPTRVFRTHSRVLRPNSLVIGYLFSACFLSRGHDYCVAIFGLVFLKGSSMVFTPDSR